MTDIVTFHVEDEEGLTDTIPFYIEEGSLKADVQAWVTQIEQDLDDFFGGVITEIVWHTQLELSGSQKTVAVVGSNREIGANFNYDYGGRSSYTVRIPALPPAAIDGENIVMAGAGATLAAEILTTTNDVEAVNKDGQELLTFKGASKSVSRKKVKRTRVTS